ncbi:LysR family transcriptional regulator [Streptosporangiaceae bacterium NEAU-GS5]|nr:LysR family transcriptional regulator [Streptosporangiaceae bacterium NEAU-GS5]
MNVMLLRYATAVMREGSFGRAARFCGVTQPALSNGIAVLERTLGGRLFDRGARGVTPTPLGERLLPLIENTLRDLDSVLAEARLAADQEPRPLHVGVSTLINRDLIEELFAAVGAVAPGRTVSLRAAPMADLRDALAQSTLDVLLTPVGEAARGFQRMLVDREPVVHVTPGLAEDGPGESDPIDLREVAALPLILPTDACGLAPFVRKVFADGGLDLRTYPGEAYDCRVLQDWVALGLGSALLPRSKVTEGAAARPVRLAGVPVVMAYETCWLANSPLRAEIAAVSRQLSGRLRPGHAGRSVLVTRWAARGRP